MILRLDKNDPSYQQHVAELRRIAAELGGEPKGVFALKSFEEFNEYKDVFHPYKTARSLPTVHPEPEKK